MKNLMKLSLVLAVAALTLSSCNCFKKMAKNRDDIQVTCTPELLVLNNGKINAEIGVTIPAKYFNAKAVAKVTPVLVFEGGEVAGTPKYYQGEKVDENYTVVAKKENGVYTLPVEFDYDERMAQSELQVRIEIKCPKGGCKELTLINANTGALASEEELELMAQESAEALALRKEFGLTIAYGINTLQEDLNYAEALTPMANNYKRVTTVVKKSDIVYSINDSRVSRKAVKELDGFKADVEETAQNDRATQHISVKGYASPDGPEQYNDKLSKARSESGKKAVAKLLKDSGLEIDAAAYGEDWEGLKELVEASDIADKNLILQVLSLYGSSAQRESEIKNMATVFEELKSDVLPKLRRSQVVNSTDIEGKTDAEMIALAEAGNFEALNNEELLFVADLLVDDELKCELLEYTANTYNDARAYNNLGIELAKQGQKQLALKAFEEAAKFASTGAEVNNNLALANLANGKVAEAEAYLQSATEETKALAAAAKGEYNAAVKNLEGTNAAIAYIMEKNYAAAKAAIAKDESAQADYLRAIIANKEGDSATAKAQLKSAISKDAQLAIKAAKDANLKNILE